MKIVTTGSRKWTNEEKIEHILLELNEKRKIEVAHGNAPGADKLVDKICKRLGIPVTPYDADWDAYEQPGKKNPAGVIRNTEMINDFEPDLGLGFYKIGELNRGTLDAVVKILQKGAKVLLIPD